jgi:hypothetical protein
MCVYIYIHIHTQQRLCELQARTTTLEARTYRQLPPFHEKTASPRFPPNSERVYRPLPPFYTGAVPNDAGLNEDWKNSRCADSESFGCYIGTVETLAVYQQSPRKERRPGASPSRSITTTTPCSPKARIERRPQTQADGYFPPNSRSMALQMHMQTSSCHSQQESEAMFQARPESELYSPGVFPQQYDDSSRHNHAPEASMYVPPQFHIDTDQARATYQQNDQFEENDQHLLLPSLNTSRASSPPSVSAAHEQEYQRSSSTCNDSSRNSDAASSRVSSSPLSVGEKADSETKDLGMVGLHNARTTMPSSNHVHVTLENVHASVDRSQDTGARTYLISKSRGSPNRDEKEDASGVQQDSNGTAARVYLISKSAGMVMSQDQAPPRAIRGNVQARVLPSKSVLVCTRDRLLVPSQASGQGNLPARVLPSRSVLVPSRERLHVPTQESGDAHKPTREPPASEVKIREASPFECEIAPVEDVPPTPSHQDKFLEEFAAAQKRLPGGRRSSCARTSLPTMHETLSAEAMEKVSAMVDPIYESLRASLIASQHMIPSDLGNAHEGTPTDLRRAGDMDRDHVSVVTLADIGCQPM